MLLLVASLCLAAGPEGIVLQGPRLARGDELVYRGEIIEAGERIDNRFRKRHELEVRLFILESGTGYAEGALLTLVRSRPDPVVADPAAVVTGANLNRQPIPPAVSLELVRIDARGRVSRLRPTGNATIPNLGGTAEGIPVPRVPIDSLPIMETGMMVPLPAAPAVLQAKWETAEADRPPRIWTIPREDVWNGGRCLVVESTQQTEAWDQPRAAVLGWRRHDTLMVGPTDGYACRVQRKIERREGSAIVGWVEVKYDLEPPTRHSGTRFQDARRDIEAAYQFAADLAPLVRKGVRTDPREFQVRKARIQRYLTDQQPPSDYRGAIEAVARRCDAALRGEAIVQASLDEEAPKAAPLTLGGPAPDFVAPMIQSTGQFHLSAHRGRPVVLVFYKPGSKTSVGSLRVAEALHRVFADKVTVQTLALGGASQTDPDREKLRLTVPLAAGDTIRRQYDVEYYPQFFVIDAQGRLVYRFEGFGDETGYLLKDQLQKLLPR